MIIGAWGLGRKSKLPYDAEVEYLESKGMQWIDTGVVPNIDAKIEVTVMGLGKPTVLSTGGSSTGAISITHWGNPFSWTVRFGNVGYVPLAGTIMIFPSSVYNITLDRYALRVNDSSVDINATSFSANDSIRLLFDIWDSGAFDVRIFECRIFSGGILVRDYQPVRFTNEQGQTEGAMYDRASGQLFRNAGTGAFVIGPDK